MLAGIGRCPIHGGGLPDRFFFGRHCLGKTTAKNATWPITEQTTNKMPAQISARGVFFEINVRFGQRMSPDGVDNLGTGCGEH